MAALVAQLQVELAELRAENQQRKKRIAELEKKNPTQRLDKSYSVKADEKRRKEAETNKSGKPTTHGSSGDQQASERRGRVPNQGKIDKAEHHELVLPDGFELPLSLQAVYQGFTTAQQIESVGGCAAERWAHLIRKAVRFNLLQPDNAEYKSFLEGLIAVFAKTKRAAADQRLREAGRAARVAQLFDDVCELSFARCGDENRQPKPDDETDREYHNLVHEVSCLPCDEELFTFVLHPEVDATNNEAERSLRGAAQDRRTGRTGKTLRDAQRRTILMSVLESLKLHLAEFTLESVLSEVQTWWHHGESLFNRIVTECGLNPLTESRRNKFVPRKTT